MKKWKKIKQRVIFKNKFITFRNDLAQRPDGEIVEYAVVEPYNHVTVICVTEKKEIILVQQFRYPWMEFSLEAPSGLIEKNESSIEAAIRETEEETGYQVEYLEYLSKYHPVGFGTSNGFLYFARVTRHKEQKLDPNEFIEVKKFREAEIDKMIADEIIVHGSTILAWFLTKTKKLLN